MSKILLLISANIRKAKGQTAILAALFLISSMMLNTGLNVFNFGSFFDRTAEELNASDAYFIIPEARYNSMVEEYLYRHEEITALQKNSGLHVYMTTGWKDETLSIQRMICDIDEPRELTQWKLVGDSLSGIADAVYVPYLYKVVGGFDLGDSMTAEICGKTYDFTVAGYIECIYHDRLYTGDMLFMPGARYEELCEDLPEYRKVLIFANGISNYAKIESALLDLTDATSAGAGYVTDEKTLLHAMSYSSMKTERTSMALMMAVMLIVFTAVITIVCLLVIRFRINNSIEEDMPRIGSLQSIGYSSAQISLSVVAQYGMIALVACLIGVIPTYLLLPVIGEVFAQQSGLFWECGFEPLTNLLAVGSLTLIVTAMALIAALEFRKITPVLALRGGILTHSFKQNCVPLDRSRLPLTMALSFKSILQGLRQSVTVFVILTAVSFTATMAAVLYYNAAVDLSVFEKVPGMERANAAIAFKPGQDTDELKKEVLKHGDVYKAQYLDIGRTVVDEVDVGVVVMEGFAGRETNNVYKGIYPRYDNEIAIPGVLASMMAKDIGDEVLAGKEERPFLITGLTQGTEAGPISVYLTLNGMRKIYPGFQQIALMIYLNDGVDAAEYVFAMEDIYAEQALSIINADASFAEGVSSFATIISLVGLAILIIAGFVVILALYFVIGSTVIRKRRELSTQKAIGYTTINLMHQISLGFVFPISLGVVAGCLLGMTTTNPLISIIITQMGIMKANFIIDTSWVIIVGIFIILFSYLASMLITWRIRKISAYALVTE